jgi:hypothetical protein
MSVKNPLSAQEVNDVIRKLAAQSNKVEVIFFDRETGIMFQTTGKLSIWEGSLVIEHADVQSSTSETRFYATSLEKLQQTPAELADPEMLKYPPCAEFRPLDLRVSFGVVFGFPNGSLLALLDVSSES